jgi:hypothetical protein
LANGFHSRAPMKNRPGGMPRRSGWVSTPCLYK